ncbi:UNVERIFIED_CONTAM: Endonuclease 2 [Sesamum radiatum]|uniref:Aspergillus nuclease S1 n=1 Tax=Sesamum radiatum TaxID=300843 RepID=A0AAW2TZF3_SESRA
MGLHNFHKLAFLVLVLCCIPVAYGWGIDGHLIICRLAQVLVVTVLSPVLLGLMFMQKGVSTNDTRFLLQPRLSKSAADAVSQLLPAYADNDLSSLCSWADRVKFRYRWSSPLHYINTPDNLCTYQYKNNLTEALLFLSHFIGDIHQPLHVGFTSDRGANTIDVRWYRRKEVLHHVWDSNIIETAEKRFYDSNVGELIDMLQKNITTVWSKQAKAWEACAKTACPDVYASEGIKAACDWAYKGVEEGSVLGDDYFLSRVPVVNLRLAQGGVRLAATLNRIFR